MKRVVNLSIIFVLMLIVFTAAHSQETYRNEKNAGGTLINQDYFTAQAYPEVKTLLYLVEAYHLNKRVTSDFVAGRYSSVLPELEYTLDKFPNHPNALQLLTALAKLINKTSLPMAYFRKALQLYPQYALTHAQYGAFLVDVGLTREGIDSLKHAIEMDPKLISAHVMLARAYYRTGQAELARQSTERARELGYTGKMPEEAGK
jgi:Tfp pilus assembly protein PilF